MRALIVAALLTVSAPAWAQSSADSPMDQLDGVMQEVLDAINLMMRAVPQYELPEVLPNGDIIIRRVPKDDLPAEKPEEKPEEGDSGVKT